MKQEDFQVVADLYKFLATFDPAAIKAAAHLPTISDNLRTALIALHKETTAQRTTTANKAGSNSAKQSTAGSLDPLGLLLDKRRFPTKKDLLALADLLKLEIKFDPKESRDRVARKIARVANEDVAVCEKLYDLVGSPKESQTAGWLDLIRRG